ncbi:MAG: hypothetical protein NVSMB47_00520 [Polyangiales bacterium]
MHRASRLSSSVLVTVLAAMASLSCSSEGAPTAPPADSGPADGPRPWDGGTACGPLRRFLDPPSCFECLDQHCAAKVCFGAGWHTSDLRGSLCDNFFACACNCPPDDPACTELCQPRMGLVCAQCAHDVRKCQEEGECQDACDPDAGLPDGGDAASDDAADSAPDAAAEAGDAGSKDALTDAPNDG